MKNQTSINLENTSSIKCKSCENEIFHEALFLRRISKFLSPTGKEEIIPISIFVCDKCGDVFTELLPDGIKLKEKKSDKY